MTHTSPTQEAMEAFAGLDTDGAVSMLNLLKFREHALPVDGFPDRSGADAYKQYAKLTHGLLKGVDARLSWVGIPVASLIGPADEKWDYGFVAEYPSKQHFFDFIGHDEYQTIALPHRTAGVEDSRLIAFVSTEAIIKI